MNPSIREQVFATVLNQIHKQIDERVWSQAQEQVCKPIFEHSLKVWDQVEGQIPILEIMSAVSECAKPG